MELARFALQFRYRAFYPGWTRKEEFVKALGLGLVFPFDRVSVSVQPDAVGELKVHIGAWKAREWKIFKLDVRGPFAAALAVRSDVCEIRAFAESEHEIHE